MSSWTPDADARLRTLWDNGASLSAIGAALGVTKNAAVGRAHRLFLPPRPSPIRGPRGVPQVARAPRVTLPPVAPVPAPVQPSAFSAPVPVPRVLSPPGVVASPPVLGRGCWWEQCRDAAVRGHYCRQHAEIMYLPRRRP